MERVSIWCLDISRFTPARRPELQIAQVKQGLRYKGVDQRGKAGREAVRGRVGRNRGCGRLGPAGGAGVRSLSHLFLFLLGKTALFLLRLLFQSVSICKEGVSSAMNSSVLMLYVRL